MTSSDVGRIRVQCLGQSGFLLGFGDTTVLVDPYLSDSVERLDGPTMRRLRPPRFSPSAIHGVDWVMVTHAHRDHCDPETLLPISVASPTARFLVSSGARQQIVSLGLDGARVVSAAERWYGLGPGLRVRPVPAAHPDIVRDDKGQPACVGFVFDWRGRRIYHAGDTSVTSELIAILRDLRPLDVAFLPVNERNFYKDKSGILGNMSVREASLMAEDLGVGTLVPMHWDMFAPNSVFRVELNAYFSAAGHRFDVRFEPELL